MNSLKNGCMLPYEKFRNLLRKKRAQKEKEALPDVIRAALSHLSHQVVDKLMEIVDLDREVMISLYSAALERTNDIDEQAEFICDHFEAFGFLQEQKISPAAPPYEAPLEPCLLPRKAEMSDGEISSQSHRFSCPVCLDNCCLSDVFEFVCGMDQDYEGDPHKLCYRCAKQHVLVDLKHGNPNIKCFAPDCQHFLLPQEIAQILGEGDSDRGQKDQHFAQIDLLQRDQAIGRIPSQFSKCPGDRCDWVVARSKEGAMEKATCPDCDISFCTNCSELYHYRTTCTERRQIQDKWYDWIISGRAHYWQQDEAMWKKARAVGGAEKRRVETVRRIELEDEQYKAEHCRLCPHCNRVVEKLEGCSIMRCGYDTDTKANVQNGCGERFDWNIAEKYTPVKIGQNVRYNRTLAPGKKHHEGWVCDGCRKEIFGLRFQCVNCPSFTLCERCEGQKISQHSKDHLFEIHEIREKH